MPLKSALRAATRSAPIRLATRLALLVLRGLDRAASALKSGLYFPDAPDAVCHRTTVVKYPENIRLGRGVVIGTRCVIGAKAPIALGDHVRISDGVVIETAGLDFSRPPPFPHVAKPILIGAGTWVGTRAIILGGARIGERCVIGAGAVVARDVPDGAIIVGQPPRERGSPGGR